MNALQRVLTLARWDALMARQEQAAWERLATQADLELARVRADLDAVKGAALSGAFPWRQK